VLFSLVSLLPCDSTCLPDFAIIRSRWFPPRKESHSLAMQAKKHCLHSKTSLTRLPSSYIHTPIALKIDEQPLPQSISTERQLNCDAEPYPYGAVDVIVSRSRLRSLAQRVLCLNSLAAVPALLLILPVPLTHSKVDDLYASGWAQQHWLFFQIGFLRINCSDSRF